MRATVWGRAVGGVVLLLLTLEGTPEASEGAPLPPPPLRGGPQCCCRRGGGAGPGASIRPAGTRMGLRGGGGTGIVPGFNIETGEWGRVEDQTGKEMQGEEVSSEESEDMGTALARHRDVVTVDQLVEFAANEAGDGNFDCAADLLLVAIEELEDKDKDAEDAPELGDVYLRYAQALADLDAQRRGGQQQGGGNATAGSGPDAVREAWEYGNKALACLERAGEGGLARRADAHKLLLRIVRGEGAEGGALGVTGEGLRELARRHEADGEAVMRRLLTEKAAARGAQAGGGEGEAPRENLTGGG